MSIVYTGIDFHKRTSTICFLDKNDKEEIKTISSDRLIYELANRKNLLVGIEASTGVNHIVDQLKRLNIDVKIINPNKFRGVGIGGKKTDKKDAQALAECLKVGFIPVVHHKSIGSRRLKSLLRIREEYVRSRVNITNHIRGILREYGIKMNAGAEAFWEEALGKIEQVDFTPIKVHLKDFVYQAKKLKRQEAEVERSIKDVLDGDPIATNIQSIPGIGFLTAAAFIAVGDDLTRFKNAKAFASYIGLVPREFSSGDKQRMGTVTKAGQEILRRYLIHGARSVMRFTNDTSKEPLRVWANKLKKKSGINKATVALAHRLARICFRVALEERLYVKVRK